MFQVNFNCRCNIPISVSAVICFVCKNLTVLLAGISELGNVPDGIDNNCMHACHRRYRCPLIGAWRCHQKIACMVFSQLNHFCNEPKDTRQPKYPRCSSCTINIYMFLYEYNVAENLLLANTIVL